MDYYKLLLLLQLLNMLGTLAVGAWVYLDRKNNKTADVVTSLGERVVQVEEGLSQAALSKGVLDAIPHQIAAVERKIDERVDVHADRLTRVEEQIKAAPTHSDLGKIYDKLNGVAESSQGVERQLQGVADNVKIIMSRIVDRGMQ